MDLRQQGITDNTVLAAIERIPRDLFVPESFLDKAYENTTLPIGYGQTISQPGVVGLMTQKLEPNPKAKVLEIGTGSGYQTAVLSKLFRRVYTIERFCSLLCEAEKRFKKLRLHNIVPRWGDGTKGWPEQTLFNRIILTAGIEQIPQLLFDQLADQGKLLAPVGNRGSHQKLIIFHKSGKKITQEQISTVRFVPILEGKSGLVQKDMTQC